MEWHFHLWEEEFPWLSHKIACRKSKVHIAQRPRHTFSHWNPKVSCQQPNSHWNKAIQLKKKKKKKSAISHESSTGRWIVKVNSWSLNHRRETSLEQVEGFDFWGQKYHDPTAVLDMQILFLPTHAELRCVSPCQNNHSKMRSTVQKCNSYSFFAGCLILYSGTLFPLMQFVHPKQIKFPSPYTAYI